MNTAYLLPRSFRQTLAFLAIFALLLTSLQGFFVSVAEAAPGASASLSQAQNGGVGDPVIDPVDWVNGNVNQSKGHYTEGQSVAYKMELTGLTPSVQAELIIGFDVTKSSMFAIDYLTSNDRINEAVDPCSDTAICSGPEDGTGTIPAPGYTGTNGATAAANVIASFNQLVADEGSQEMKIWNGVIDSITYTTQADISNSDEEARVTILFTPNAGEEDVVISWGGRIASSLDYPGQSAIDISGSPYHMRLISLNGSGGNQDRSLSASAVSLPGNLTVIKNVVNDNGGTAVAGDFTIDVAADTSADPAQFAGEESGTPVTIETVNNSATNYSVTEQAAAGYEVSYSPDCTGSIGEQETKTCTITNDDIPPALTLVKNVDNTNGGSAVASDWTVTAAGDNTTPAQISGNGTVSSGADFDAGTYTLSESGGPVLNEGIYQAGAWSCTNGVTVDQNNQITLGLGATTTCTITNTYIPPDKASLTVVKTVENNYGGTASTSTFQYFVTSVGNVVTEVFSGILNMFDPGSYTVSETGLPAGYAASDWGTDCNADGTIDMVKDGNYTCTITNSDTPAKLTVEKVVNNGTNKNPKVASDFDIVVTATDINDTAATTTTFAGDAGGTEVTFDAGSYSVNEPNHDGYTVSYSDSCFSSIAGDMALGETRTCTVTNTYIEPTETVINFFKVVNNNFGGTATSGDFSFDVSGSETHNGIVDGGQIVVGLGSYSIAENGPSGYEVEDYSTFCSGGTFNIEQADLGETYNCTITNRDIQPTLTVIKNVENDNQFQVGTAVASDFTMNATGTNISQTSFAGDSNGTVLTLNAGSFEVTEQFAQGYAVTYSLDGGATTTAGCLGTIAVGENRTCTVTNNDLDPTSATVIFDKIVNNNFGGTATSGDFFFTVGGDIATTTVSPGDSLKLGIGNYTVSENDVNGYQIASISTFCAGGAFTITAGELGQSFQCTYTNEDIEPQLTVVKVVQGGSATTSDFDLSVTPSQSTSSVSVVSGETNGFNAGTYTVSESFDPQVGNYTASYSGACNSNGEVALNIGDNATCTITNSAYTVTGFKWEDENGDGIKDQLEDRLANWTIVATDEFGNITTATTSVAGFYEFNLGEGVWTISELQQGGWTQTFPTNASGTCQFTFGPNTTDFNPECNFGNQKDFIPDLSCNVFTASPNSNVSSGSDVILAWNTTDADYVTIDQGVGDGLARDGSTTTNPTADTVYTLTAARYQNRNLSPTDIITPNLPNEPVDEVTCQVAVDIDSGGGGSSSPVCRAFDIDRNGDTVTLTWETVRGSELSIAADGTEIFSTSDNSEVSSFSFDTQYSSGTEYELVVSRGSRDDNCFVTISDGGGGSPEPEGQVLGEQVSVVPLGAADTGAGGSAPLGELPALPRGIVALFTSRIVKNAK